MHPARHTTYPLRAISLSLRRALVVAAVVTLVALSTGCAAAESALQTVDQIAVQYTQEPTATYPSITPVEGAPDAPDAVMRWEFEGEDVSITVPVDGAVLLGAQSANKSASIPAGWEKERWEPDYYRAFIDDSQLESLYRALITELRALRDDLGLDGDRYVELIVTMAQAIPYETDGSPPKFPIETVAEAAGDCDDKALLAAALLAREGYAVSLLGFTAENHMALGIESNGSAFRETTTSFVEMTTSSLVGWYNRDPDIESADGQRLESTPTFIAIGAGKLAYGAGGQADAIRDAYDGYRAKLEPLEGRIEEARRDHEALRADVDSRAAQLDELHMAGDVEGYNALVDGYNDTLAKYNAAIETYNKLVKQQRAAAERANRILEQQNDRRGLAAWLGV